MGNAAGILTRVLTVFDAVRQVAEWMHAGSRGAGPLGVPAPARAAGTPAPQPQRPGQPQMRTMPLEADDLGLPPRMTAPAAIV